jgi:hypothetical protein
MRDQRRCRQEMGAGECNPLEALAENRARNERRGEFRHARGNRSQMSGRIAYASAAMTALALYENGDIDAHAAEQRLMDEGWSIAAIDLVLEPADG